MTALKFIERIERLHTLIKRGGTGTPRELASRLQMSESTVYEYIKTLKALGAPLIYDNYRQSYVYQKSCSLQLKYSLEALDYTEVIQADAGYCSAPVYTAYFGIGNYYY